MRELIKNLSLTFFNPFRPTLSLARGTNRRFSLTGVISITRLDNYYFVSVDRKTFWGFEMTSNSLNTSPLRIINEQVNAACALITLS